MMMMMIDDDDDDDWWGMSKACSVPPNQKAADVLSGLSTQIRF